MRASALLDELNRAEDQLQAAQKANRRSGATEKAAVEKLNALIAGISFEWDVKTE